MLQKYELIIWLQGVEQAEFAFRLVIASVQDPK